jgi:proteasome accessory factor A
VQVQGAYLDLALSYTAGRDNADWVPDVLEKWADALGCLERDPMELSDKIDWVIKKSMIESFMERKGLDWESSQVSMLDLQYHDTRPDKGLYYILERQGKVLRIVSDEEISAAIHTPPEDTRAYFRGECLSRYPEQVFGVNWDSISFANGDEPIRRVMMAEPLKGSRLHVEELLNRSQTAEELMANLRA